jgi:hypothetical protein
MVIELYEPGKMCLIYCGDEACTCGLSRMFKTPLIKIPEKNVRKIPIRKKKKK